jgi:hypothetical protein
MASNISQAVGMIPDPHTQKSFRALAMYAYDQLSTNLLTSAALAINGAGNAAVKAGSAFYAACQGVLVTKAANQVMPALSGTVANGKFNVFCFFIDKAGNLTSSMGTAGATLATIGWPAIPQSMAMIGFVIINPTGTGSFVGGTTALDDATVVPNAVYINTLGGFDPSATYTF